MITGHTTTEPARMTEEQIAFARENWNDSTVIKTILTDLAKRINDVEANIAREFMESVVKGGDLSAWQIACLAADSAAWSYSRGYSNGINYLPN